MSSSLDDIFPSHSLSERFLDKSYRSLGRESPQFADDYADDNDFQYQENKQYQEQAQEQSDAANTLCEPPLGSWEDND